MPQKRIKKGAGKVHRFGGDWTSAKLDLLAKYLKSYRTASNLELRGIDWVILGGESGPKARPMDADWARDLHDQCLIPVLEKVAKAGAPLLIIAEAVDTRFVPP